jgi:hypothetical protein
MFTYTHPAEARCKYIFIAVAHLTGTGCRARIRTRTHLIAAQHTSHLARLHPNLSIAAPYLATPGIIPYRYVHPGSIGQKGTGSRIRNTAWGICRCH